MSVVNVDKSDYCSGHVDCQFPVDVCFGGLKLSNCYLVNFGEMVLIVA